MLLRDAGVIESTLDTEQEKLPEPQIYGQHLFRDKNLLLYTSATDVRPSDDYVIGPGDRVTISIWGLSQEEASYTVNKSGYIKPSAMPRIQLKGLTMRKARSLLESRFSQFYRFRPEEFEVTVSYARTITVNIYGEVFNPGDILSLPRIRHLTP